MPVHAESVIPLTVYEYDIDFYTALTDKENYCYTQSTQPDGTLTNYKPFFQALADAISAYFTGSFDSSAFSDLLQGMYSFVMLNAQYGYREDLKASLPSIYVFDMAGLRDLMLSRPVDYYDDFYIEVDLETGVQTNRAPNLEADTTTTAEQAVDTTNANAEALAATVTDANRTLVNKLLYLDVYTQAQVDAYGWTEPALPYLVQTGQAPAKRAMRDLVFVEYGYDVHLALFGVAGVDPFSE